MERGNRIIFVFRDSIPDVYDFELIQQHVSFEECVYWSWSNRDPELFASNNLVVKRHRDILAVFKQNGKLINVVHKLKFSGNLESDFRTFYSIFSAVKNSHF